MNGLKQAAFAYGELFIANSSLKKVSEIVDESLKGLV